MRFSHKFWELSPTASVFIGDAWEDVENQQKTLNDIESTMGQGVKKITDKGLQSAMYSDKRYSQDDLHNLILLHRDP